MNRRVLLTCFPLSLLGCAHAEKPATTAPAAPVKTAVDALRSMSGCFIVDYDYAETEKLDPAYTLDSRVYDGSRKNTVYEWIVPVQSGADRFRLQHVLFARNAEGKQVYKLRHQAEDWVRSPTHWYDFQTPGHWKVRAVEAKAGEEVWVRRITNLDDGLRYQCVASWHFEGVGPQWSCDDFAPIPGRETRDMGRKDYQALDRSTTLKLFGDSWLERQSNAKVKLDGDARHPLVREVGKTWYVRQPDETCAEIAQWSLAEAPFWGLLSEVWDEVLDGKTDWAEQVQIDGATRFMHILGGQVGGKEIHGLEEKYDGRLGDPAVRAEAKAAVRAVIDQYRAP